jgi:hypothetical protein
MTATVVAMSAVVIAKWNRPSPLLLLAVVTAMWKRPSPLLLLAVVTAVVVGGRHR